MFSVAALVLSGVAVWAAQSGWAPAGWALLLAGLPLLARLRDSVEIGRAGMRIGPAWAPRLGWHEVKSVRWCRRGTGVTLWVSSSRGSPRATIPAVLLPAVRARTLRLGGIEIEQATFPDLDAHYGWLHGPASGLPWGILVGTAIGCSFLDSPWPGLVAGLGLTGAAAMLAAAIEARVSGWGAGAVLWLVVLYGSALAVVGAAWRGLL